MMIYISCLITLFSLGMAFALWGWALKADLRIEELERGHENQKEEK